MNKIIINFHIPKTAGTTFGQQMYRTLIGIPNAFHNIHLADDTSDGDNYTRLRRKFQERFSAHKGQGLKFFTGHYRYVDVADILAPYHSEISLITFLRDPVRRIISNYFYIISERHPDWKNVIARYPDIESYILSSHGFNTQFQYLQPHANATIDETIAFVREQFDFIGRTESFDKDLKIFCSTINLSPPEPQRYNESPNAIASEEAYESYHNQISEGCMLDIALYNAFTDLMVKL